MNMFPAKSSGKTCSDPTGEANVCLLIFLGFFSRERECSPGISGILPDSKR
jgi:hypothetical protein